MLQQAGGGGVHGLAPVSVMSQRGDRKGLWAKAFIPQKGTAEVRHASLGLAILNNFSSL